MEERVVPRPVLAASWSGVQQKDVSRLSLPSIMY